MSSGVKPELEKLNVKLGEINEIAVGINTRQERIIETAKRVNESLKEQIEEEINNKKCYEGSEERIKGIKERIEKISYVLKRSDDFLWNNRQHVLRFVDILIEL